MSSEVCQPTPDMIAEINAKAFVDAYKSITPYTPGRLECLAVHAMNGILSNQTTTSTPELIAAASVQVAKALIAELEKHQ